MRGEKILELLKVTKRLLGDRPWGVGLLGFLPQELWEEQILAVLEMPPPFALIAGGQPHQVARLESRGIPTYIHVPSPALPESTTNDSSPSTGPVLTEHRLRELDKSVRQRVFPPADFGVNGRKNKPAVFILSPPRSGSTLLRVMLAGNTALFPPPELNLLGFKTFGDFKNYASHYHFPSSGIERAIMELCAVELQEAKDILDDFAKRNISVQECYAFIQDRLGDRLLVDKSPAYSASLPVLRRAEVLFDSPYYIHLMRHPYGMIRSFVEVKTKQLFDLPFSGRELAEYLWLRGHQNILALLKNVPARRQFHVKFEDLVSSPRNTMEDLCRFLSIPFAEGMLRPYEGEKMTDGRFEEEMMVGDPRFFSHQTIDPRVAERSRERLDRPICDLAKEIAMSLGYSDL